MTTEQAMQLALQHHQAGRLAEAEKIYREVLAEFPDHAEALNFLGILAGQSGRNELSLEMITRAIGLKPTWAGAHNNLGNVLKEMGRLDEAIAAYSRAIQLKPDHANAHDNLGVALSELGQRDGAIAAHNRTIQLQADFANAQNNLGAALRKMGRVDEAIAAHRRAIQLKPDYASAHNNLGVALSELGRFDEATAAYDRAIQLKPDYSKALINLGNALKEMGRVDEAIDSYRRAVSLNPNSAAVHGDPLLGAMLYCHDDPAAIMAENERWAARHAAPLAEKIRPHDNDRDPDRRLRIGYFSPDLREHAVTIVLEGLLANHHHDRFEIFCYADVKNPDAVTERLKGYADQWRDLQGVSDDAAAEIIRADRIDILIDLAGHMTGNRMLLFARKPAPVQVTHIAYPASTGLPTIDYRITDPYLDPPGGDPCGPEEPVRLPHTYWCYRPGSEEPAVAPLPALSRGQVTFGSLNSLGKVSPGAIALWCRVLHAVADSRMMILTPRDPGTQAHLLKRFAGHGIARDRLELVGRQKRREYLEIYNQIDIGLDPLPYTGHTTSLDSFWMGVPVVTLPGRTSVSRGGASLASNLNLPELIATTPEEYVKIATKIAGDLPRLSNLRGQLRQRMKDSPLMDEKGYTRDLENAYRTMWHRWLQNP